MIYNIWISIFPLDFEYLHFKVIEDFWRAWLAVFWDIIYQFFGSRRLLMRFLTNPAISQDQNYYSWKDMKFLICLKKKFVKKYWLRKKLWRNNFRKLANFSYILAIFRRAITFFSGNMPVWIFDMLLSSSRSIELCIFIKIGRYKFFCHSHETP